MTMNSISTPARGLVLLGSALSLALGCGRLADLDDREGFSTYADDDYGAEGEPDPGGPGGNGTPSESCYDDLVEPGEICQVQPPEDIPAGVDPCSLSVADFDEDGRPDLAVPNSDPYLTPGSVHVANVLRGYGNGNFAPSQAISAGAELPVGLAVGDFDGDGRVDIATANNEADQAFVMSNAGGDVSFADPSGVGVGSTASSIAAGDLDGDGRDDIVVNTPDGIALLQGVPGGALHYATLDVGTGTSMHAELVDLDEDGFLDLVSAVSDPLSGHRLVIFHGAGDGSFPEQVEHALDGDPWWVVAGDVNMDGDPDLVAAEYGGDAVSILLGNNLGGFSPRTVLDVCEGPQSVALGDLNVDGATDIAVGCMDSDRVQLWIQIEGGEFELARWFNTGSRPVSVQIHDLNLDGVPDVAWANQFSNSVGVLISQP